MSDSSTGFLSVPPVSSRCMNLVIARQRINIFNSKPSDIKRYSRPGVDRDGHDKPFGTKAITIIDNFKKALDDTDNR